MKKTILAFCAVIILAAVPALAEQKSTSALQADLSTYKLRSFNAEADYQNKLNITDSMFNKTTDDVRDIAGLSGLSDAELGFVDGVTAGTVTASKAVVVDASKNASGINNLGIEGDLTGDGTDQLLGFLQNTITSTTTGLTAAQCGSTIVNDSADVLTLPEASTVIGCRFTFITNSASNFDINPADASDTITLLTNAAGDAIRNATIGNFVCLQAVDATNWSQCGILGTWSDVN